MNPASKPDGNNHFEIELRERHRQYESLVHSIDGIVWEVDAATFGFTFVSKKAEQILGYPSAQWLEPNFWTDHLHPDDRDTAVNFCVDSTQRRVDHQFEYRMIAADGREVWLRDHVTVSVGMDGSVCLSGVMFDITESKRAEDTLRKQKEILQKIVDHIPAMINFTDSDGRISLVNRAWEQTIGWSLEEIRKEKIDVFAECYPDPKYRQKVMDFLKVATGEWADFTTRKRDGSVIDTSWARVRLSDGTSIGIGQDITERKRAEDELRRSEDRIRLVTDAIPTMAWSLRADGAIDFVNARWMDYTGISLEEEIEEPTRVMHPEDVPRVMENWLVAKATGEASEEELRLRRADGEYRWFLVRTAPLRDEEGNVVKWFGMAIDIEDRKGAEDRLRATSEQLRALSASLQSAREEEGTRIAREIHDELGATLSSLRWDLEELDEGISESGDQSKLLGMREKIEAMMRLTDTTIDTVRRIASELRPIALDALGLAEAIELQAHQFQARTGIVVEYYYCSENVDLTGEQSTAIFRILQEALTNVLRHARATRVFIRMSTDMGEFILTISDNGRGITDEEKSGTRTLGILGMRERANLVGGIIDIANADGNGTIVTVRTPLAT